MVTRYLARGISATLTAVILLFAIGEALGSGNHGIPIIRDYEHIKMSLFCLLIAAGTALGWWRDKLGGLILFFTGILMSLLRLIDLKNQDYWIRERMHSA